MGGVAAQTYQNLSNCLATIRADIVTIVRQLEGMKPTKKKKKERNIWVRHPHCASVTHTHTNIYIYILQNTILNYSVCLVSGMKYMKRTAGHSWRDYKTNEQIAKDLKITPHLDKLLEYKRNWIQHVNRMPRNTTPQMTEGIMIDLWRDFWMRETGMTQQVAQFHDRYMMSSKYQLYCLGIWCHAHWWIGTRISEGMSASIFIVD